MLYDIAGVYSPLTGDHAEAYLSANCRPDRIGHVRDAVLDAISRLATDGPSAAEISQELDLYVRSFADPQSGLGVLDAAAADHLRGRNDTLPNMTAEKIRSLSPSVVARYFAEEIVRNALFQTPEDLALAGGGRAITLIDVATPQELVVCAEHTLRPDPDLRR